MFTVREVRPERDLDRSRKSLGREWRESKRMSPSAKRARRPRSALNLLWTAHRESSCV